MADGTHPARVAIEQAALVLKPESGYPPSEAETAVSIAISLKRIADVLGTITGDGIPLGLFNQVLELAYQAGTSFQAGQRVG